MLRHRRGGRTNGSCGCPCPPDGKWGRPRWEIHRWPWRRTGPWTSPRARVTSRSGSRFSGRGREPGPRLISPAWPPPIRHGKGPAREPPVLTTSEGELRPAFEVSALTAEAGAVFDRLELLQHLLQAQGPQCFDVPPRDFAQLVRIAGHRRDALLAQQVQHR